MNNTNVVILARSNLRTISFGISLPVGTATEPIPGISSLMMSHIQRNNSKYDENEFANLIDKYGITTSGDASRTSINLRFTTPPQHLDKAMEILTDMVLSPKFEETTINQLAQQQKGMIQQIKSTPESILSNYTKYEVAFGSDLITKHPIGTDEGIEQITIEELDKWHKEIISFQPYFASVGVDTDENKLNQVGLSDFLSQMGNKDPTMEVITQSNNPLAKQVDSPSMPSSNAYIGVNLRGTDPKKGVYAEDLYRAILSGGMSARMFTEIREKRNLSYAPRVSVDKFYGGALYTAMMDVRPDKSVEALETTIDLLYNAFNEPIEVEEMNRALKGALRIAVFVSDSSPTYVDFILNRLVTGQDYDLDLVKDKLTQTSKQDWQSEIRNIWDKSNISFAVCGEAKDVENVENAWEEKIGKVF